MAAAAVSTALPRKPTPRPASRMPTMSTNIVIEATK
jgi:hypothetical protein